MEEGIDAKDLLMWLQVHKSIWILFLRFVFPLWSCWLCCWNQTVQKIWLVLLLATTGCLWIRTVPYSSGKRGNPKHTACLLRKVKASCCSCQPSVISLTSSANSCDAIAVRKGQLYLLQWGSQVQVLPERQRFFSDAKNRPVGNKQKPGFFTLHRQTHFPQLTTNTAFLHPSR